eukprot:6095511-Pyramimonas_sp.AAC.1
MSARASCAPHVQHANAWYMFSDSKTRNTSTRTKQTPPRIQQSSPGVDGHKGRRLQFNSRQSSSTVDAGIPLSAHCHNMAGRQSTPGLVTNQSPRLRIENRSARESIPRESTQNENGILRTRK